MPLSTLKDLLVQQLDELHGGERHASGVLTRLAKSANSNELARLLRTLAEHSRDRVTALDGVLADMDAPHRRAETKGMKGLLEDCMRLSAMAGVEPHVRDAALIAVAQHVLHDGLAGYGCARTWSMLLGLDKIATDLDASLKEVRRADSELTKVGDRINREAVAPLAM